MRRKRIFRKLLTLFVQTNMVEAAVCNTDIFVHSGRIVHPIPAEMLVTYRSVLRFAKEFFNDLSEVDKMRFKNLRDYALLSREIYTEAEEIENSKALRELFNDFEPDKKIIKAEIASPPTVKTPSSPAPKSVLPAIAKAPGAAGKSPPATTLPVAKAPAPIPNPAASAAVKIPSKPNPQNTGTPPAASSTLTCERTSRKLATVSGASSSYSSTVNPPCEVSNRIMGQLSH